MSLTYAPDLRQVAKQLIGFQMKCSISVIIPTVNEPTLEVCLSKLIPQLGWEDETLVIGRFSPSLEPKFPKVRFISTPERVNPATARNLGMQKAKGDLFLFLDSDCIPSEGWIENHRKCQIKGLRVVGGGVDISNPNFWILSDNLSMFHEFSSTQPDGEKFLLPTCNLSVHREVVQKVGGLNELLPRGEDSDWTIRMKKAGYSLNFFCTISVLHCPMRGNWRLVFEHWFQSGRNNVRVRLNYPEAFGVPRWIYHPICLRFFSPLIALITTLKIFSHQPFWKLWRTFPAVYLTKVIYCWGAATK